MQEKLEKEKGLTDRYKNLEGVKKTLTYFMDGPLYISRHLLGRDWFELNMQRHYKLIKRSCHDEFIYTSTGKPRFKKIHFSFIMLFDLRNVYVLIQKKVNQSFEKKKYILQLNLQVEIFLKSRIHCTNLHTIAEYVIRFKCFKAKNKN